MYRPLNLQQLAQHTIILAGLGREGWSTYQFLHHQLPNASFVLFDDRSPDNIDQKWLKAKESNQNISQTINNDHKTWPTNSIIFRTPGLPPHHPSLSQSPFPVTSNTQLFFDLLETEPELFPTSGGYTTIGITGTKGKSTTTALIAQVLKTAGFAVRLGGNIGVPPLDLLETTSIPAGQHLYFVLEMSAHQLADLKVSPHIAVVQNIVPEHLDYYRDFQEYVIAKSQITRWQKPTDLVIFNPDFSTASELAGLGAAQKLPFRIETYQDWLLYQDEPIIRTSDIPLVGDHNWQNVLPAIVIAKHLNIPTPQLVQGITTFRALEHRLELVGEKNDVKYYNDSLSTVPDAAMAAIKAFPQEKIILLAGGYERHQDFSELAALLVEHHARAVLLFPTTGERLKKSIETYVQQHPQTSTPILKNVSSMLEAVQQATELAQPGDVVLMSPASPSFGEFTDYRDRGDQFRAAVHSLTD